MIYLDNAATTLHKPPEVAEAVKNAILTAGNASRGAHGVSLSASRMVFETRSRLAKLFGCPRADHVVFTANSAEALNIAIYGLFSSGDHVISTDLEHHSVLRPLYDLQTRGVSVDFVPVDRQGNIRYEDMETLFRPGTKAVVCTHASNLTGNLLDIAQIGAMAHAHGALLVVRGGTGIHSYDREQPQAYPARLEAGTLNTHGIAGLHAALKFIEKQTVQAIGAHERALMRRFYDGVKDLDGVTVYGDFSRSERAAVVALNIRDYDSAEVADALFADYDIATRAGAHCAPRMHEALGTVQQGAVRFSFSYFNTENEVDTAIAAVRELAE